MSKAIIDEQSLTDIADAIRAKNGSADTYTPSEMATAITDLPTPTPVTKGLVFSDYDSDGYPHKAEFVGLTSIPAYSLYTDNDTYYTMLKKITSITIPEGVTRLESSALRNIRLTDITLPSTISIINNYVFEGTKITRLVLPASYTQVLVDALANIAYCQEIVFEGDVTAIARYGFEQTGNRASSLTIDFSHCTSVPILENANAFASSAVKVFKVPSALLSTWQNATNWVGLTNVTWQGV